MKFLKILLIFICYIGFNFNIVIAQNFNEVTEEVFIENTIEEPTKEIVVEDIVVSPIDEAIHNLQQKIPSFVPVDKSLYNSNMKANDFFKILHSIFNQNYIEKYLPKSFQYLTREDASFTVQNIINPNKSYIDYKLYNKVKDLKDASFWSKKGIEDVINNGLLSLDKDNKFYPKKHITYFEGYIFFNNILNKNYKIDSKTFFDGVNKTYKFLNMVYMSFSPKTSNLENMLKKHKDVSVYYKDLYSNKEYKYNTSQTYGISSTGKAPYITYIYYLASIGEINLNEKIKYQSRHIKGGSGVLRDKKLGTSYSIQELCEFAIVKSDNTAIKMLTDKVPVSKYKNFLKKIGYKNIDKLRYVTGADITVEDAGFFMRFINDFIENNKYGSKLKSDMLNATPSFIVSNNYKIANKSGWWNENFHDLSIVYANRPYILVICTKKSGDFKFFKDVSLLVENMIK